MNNEIKFSKEARNKLVKGIDTLSKAVVCTLGPNGRNVVIKQPNQMPLSTKDGVTVAKSIKLKDATEDLGVQLVKQAAIKTHDKAGDGTTTSTLLARELVINGLQHLENNVNAVELKRDIDKAVEKVINFIHENISEDISSEDQLEQIATISANNDIEVGKLISTALDKVGLEGVVHIEESRTGETYLETVEGMQFDRGYKSPYFVTDNNTMSAVLENPYILMANTKFTQVKELLPILEKVSSEGRSLLIIADDVDGEALATLIVNKMRGIMKVVVVKSPDYGDKRTQILEDIAITTGGTVFSKEKGMQMERFSMDWFGSARNVTITKDQTTIVDGQGDAEVIENRIKQIQTQIESSNTAFETEHLQNRLAKFVGGVSIVHVGGNTETEMKEKKDRVDDALHATRAAIEEGIVPGGGIALLYASQVLRNVNLGENIVKRACIKPFTQILINAGIDPVESELIALNLLDNNTKTSDYNVGYNIKLGEVGNMKEFGIIDPTKVTRNALQNAASIAGTILLTECTIVEMEDESDKTQLMDPMGMY